MLREVMKIHLLMLCLIGVNHLKTYLEERRKQRRRILNNQKKMLTRRKSKFEVRIGDSFTVVHNIMRLMYVLVLICCARIPYLMVGFINI
jgi:hypothetical protein